MFSYYLVFLRNGFLWVTGVQGILCVGNPVRLCVPRKKGLWYGER